MKIAPLILLAWSAAADAADTNPRAGTMLKTGMNYLEIYGERVSPGLGYRFIFHNTALQPGGALDVFSSHELHNAVSRNNIFYARGAAYPKDSGAPRNDFKNDLTGGYLGGGDRALDVSAQRAAGVVSGAHHE